VLGSERLEQVFGIRKVNGEWRPLASLPRSGGEGDHAKHGGGVIGEA